MIGGAQVQSYLLCSHEDLGSRNAPDKKVTLEVSITRFISTTAKNKSIACALYFPTLQLFEYS